MTDRPERQRETAIGSEIERERDVAQGFACCLDICALSRQLLQ